MQAPSTPPAIPPPCQRRLFSPHIYIPSLSWWAPLSANSPNAAPLPRDKVIRLISWNIDFSIPSHGSRTTTALDHLASLFSPASTTATTMITTTTTTPSAPMLLMLQEMSAESLAAVLVHPWVRAAFIVSEKAPLPQSYFTLLLADRRLATGDWFRSAYAESRFGRDVLGVDVLVALNDGDGDGDDSDVGTYKKERPKRYLRFLTTHLESLAEEPGFELRPQQLAQVSQLLKQEAHARCGLEIILGGVVGGDMNAISEVDEGIHRRGDVGLRDVWEESVGDRRLDDEDGLDGKEGEEGEEDETFGRAEGHTWGYQARGRWPPRRFDKFFYTGCLEVVALDEVEDSSGAVGRLGVGLKTQKGLWVSDHFGIAVEVKVV